MRQKSDKRNYVKCRFPEWHQTFARPRGDPRNARCRARRGGERRFGVFRGRKNYDECELCHTLLLVRIVALAKG
jgi:hypothetical protein